MNKNELCNPYHFGVLLISPGELTDKLTILHLKREVVEDPNQGYFIQDELCRTSMLLDIILSNFSEEVYNSYQKLQDELRAINKVQWGLEDRVRNESTGEAARAARENNNFRVQKKNEICSLLGYPIEIKKYRSHPNDI